MITIATTFLEWVEYWWNVQVDEGTWWLIVFFVFFLCGIPAAFVGGWLGDWICRRFLS